MSAATKGTSNISFKAVQVYPDDKEDILVASKTYWIYDCVMEDCLHQDTVIYPNGTIKIVLQKEENQDEEMEEEKDITEQLPSEVQEKIDSFTNHSKKKEQGRKKKEEAKELKEPTIEDIQKMFPSNDEIKMNFNFTENTFLQMEEQPKLELNNFDIKKLEELER